MVQFLQTHPQGTATAVITVIAIWLFMRNEIREAGKQYNKNLKQKELPRYRPLKSVK